MTYVIASSQIWNQGMASELSDRTGRRFILLDKKEELTFERLRELNPRYVFFPHWSFMIPAPIFESFECVIFHMTDLPFGRGGSPLQNLIARGIYETKISALRCVAGLDAGPVFMKRPLSLYGSAEEIYLRAAAIIEAMIADIVQHNPVPQEQAGEVVCFSRRKPQESNLAGLTELEKVFDYIRMLDAEGYPKAFLETEHLRLEFKRPSMKRGRIVADVVITKKG